MKKSTVRLAAFVLLGILFLVGIWPDKPADTGADPSFGAAYEEPVNIHIRSADAVRQRNGLYSVEVVFTADAVSGLRGMRLVTVFCEGQQTELFLDADNLWDVHTVCLRDVPQPETVRLEVRYYQTEDGLLLMQEGEGQLCAEAEAAVNGDRILALTGGTPGESYRIYRIAGLSELLSGMVVLKKIPTVKELDAYAVSGNHIATLTVETDGSASINFTREGCEDGLYMAVGEGKSFYFCLPVVDASGDLRNSVCTVALGDGIR